MHPGSLSSSENASFTVLFDGDCALCHAWVERLRTSDPDGRLRFVSIRDPGNSDLFPEISAQAREASLHLVRSDGTTWEGPAAIEELVSVLPEWRKWAWVFRLPPFRVLFPGAYRWFARNRGRIAPRGSRTRGAGKPPDEPTP